MYTQTLEILCDKYIQIYFRYQMLGNLQNQLFSIECAALLHVNVFIYENIEQKFMWRYFECRVLCFSLCFHGQKIHEQSAVYDIMSFKNANSSTSWS